jgi:hypothetical protein
MAELSPDSREINDVSDLSFGHYVQVFAANWEAIGLPFDRTIILDNLSVVNRIRNIVMHFRPEPVAPDSVVEIDWCLNWLRECPTGCGADE